VKLLVNVILFANEKTKTKVMSIGKYLSLLAFTAALSNPESGGDFIPETTGTKSRGSSIGKIMPKKQYRSRKKKMQMQSESRRINRK
jgi:hypothetical protein